MQFSQIITLASLLSGAVSLPAGENRREHQERQLGAPVGVVGANGQPSAAFIGAEPPAATQGAGAANGGAKKKAAKAAKAPKENPNLGVPGVPNLQGLQGRDAAVKENPNLGVPGVPNLQGLVGANAPQTGGAKKAAKAPSATGSAQNTAQTKKAATAPKENPNLGVPGVPNLQGIARS